MGSAFLIKSAFYCFFSKFDLPASSRVNLTGLATRVALVILHRSLPSPCLTRQFDRRVS